MASAGVLSCRDLSKAFDGRPALAPLSLSIDEGEHLAVVGPTGSGKTTLVRLLAGLLEPSAGRVFEGTRVVCKPGWRLAPHRRHLGVLFQGLALWPHMTVREQVEFSLPPLRAPHRRDRRRRAAAVLSEAGLEALRDRYPAQLSGGERQRVAWARAVAGEPRLLFLDEPLTSLDPGLKAELLDSVVRYGEAPGRTVIVVTHDPDVARRVGRRVLALTRAAE